MAEPWPHESCFECRLKMPSDEAADAHYAMTGHAMGWTVGDEDESWPIASDDQIAPLQRKQEGGDGLG